MFLWERGQSFYQKILKGVFFSFLQKKCKEGPFIDEIH